MGRNGSQIRNSDVTGWGIAAIACGALAVLTANVAMVLPDNLMAGLHATRISGGSFNQLRTQVSQLRAENQRVIRDSRALINRFNLLDQGSGETVRRLAAVERSLPLLIEALPLDSDIDRSLLTASIGAQASESAAEVTIRQRSLFPDETAAALPAQPIPPALVPEMPVIDVASVAPSSAEASSPPQGIAVGPHLDAEEAASQWTRIMDTVGPLLLGLEPLITRDGSPQAARLVVGPLPSPSAATVLCDRLERVAVACDLAPYAGEPLSL